MSEALSERMAWRRRLVLVAIVFFAGAANSAQYYVAPNGQADAPGTRQRPWTLAKANAAARPGDVLVFLPGDYEGVIEPAASGVEGRPIIFRSQRARAARLRGGISSDGVPTCLRLKEKAHLVLEGFDLVPQNHTWLRLDGCRFVRLANLRMRQGQGAYVTALVQNCHYCRFEDLDIGRSIQTDANGHVTGNMLQLNASSHNLIWRCRFSQAGHCPFCLWPDSHHNVVRESVFDCRWGRNFELFTAPHTLMEGCVITNALHGSGSADGRAKLFIWEGIFRRNLIYRNWYQPLTIHAYKYEEMEPFGMINSRLYHNTFYYNYESGFEMFDIAPRPEPHMVRGNILQNNLFALNDSDGDGVQLNLGGNISPDNRFLYNLFWAGRPNTPVIRYVWPEPIPERPQSSLRTAEDANRQRPEQFIGNREGDPLFVNPAQDDYRLRRGSPAIDAGGPLTRTTAAGRSDRLPVADARPFYDGYGIPGEEGDLIFIGPRKKPARVLKADSAANVLQLDRPVAFQRGDAVTLPFVGQGPDIGAYEFGAEKQSWNLAPRPTPRERMETLATATEPFIRIGFEAENMEDWFYWLYTHRQPNTAARIVETTAAHGRHSLRIFATGERATLSALLRPPEWEIDRFPFVRFAYRIPPGTPVGVRLEAMASERRGAFVFVGGTAARATGNVPDLQRVKLQDDDQWHEATIDVRWIRALYPGVRLLRTFWFYTHANGQAGQQFWIDELRIEQE